MSIETFGISDFVINDKTVTLCRTESKDDLVPEDGK